jgi:hypothetical protein
LNSRLHPTTQYTISRYDQHAASGAVILKKGSSKGSAPLH